MRASVAIVAAALLLTAMAGWTAAAGRPESVAISSTMIIGGDFNTGDFTRTDGSGLICSSGAVVDTRYVWGASHGVGGSPDGVQLQVDKTFDCGDGLVFFRLQIHGVFAIETFTWVVLGGTGPYAGLRGQGDGWTDGSNFDSCTCVVNYYSGSLGQ